MIARRDGSRTPTSYAKHPPTVDGEATDTIDCRRVALTFGRSRACGVVLDAPAVEPRHAALFATGDRFELIDQSATAGTLVNTGDQVYSGTIAGSAPVMIHDDQFRFEVNLATGEESGRVYLLDGMRGIADHRRRAEQRPHLRGQQILLPDM